MGIRGNIHNVVVEELSDLSDIKLIFKHVFQLYDYCIFDSQISSKLKNRIVISKGTLSFASFVTGNKGRIVWFINPKKLHLLEGDDVIYKVQTAVQFSMLHMAMILWGYMDGSKKYTQYGGLFRCIANSMLNSTDADVDAIIGKIGASYKSIKPVNSLVKMPLLTNWSGSCYLDSLLIALFLSSSPYYRREMLIHPPSLIKYGKFPICNIESDAEMKRYATAIQNALKVVYKRLTTEGDNFQCTDIRRLLVRCIPEIYPYRPYHASDIYDALADIFPLIKFKLPYISGETSVCMSMIQMWDYLDPETHINWDNVDIDNLVFRNGFLPPIKHFDSIEPEIVKTHGAIPGKFVAIERDGKEIMVPEFGEITEEIAKARSFDTWLNLKKMYRLYAAVMHSGSRREGSGGHYTAYIRRGNIWYYYNDISPTWKKLRRVPGDLFKDLNDSRPELLFYHSIG